MQLGDKLRAQRAEMEMTQQQVAEALKIDKTTYAHYESGRRKPDIEKLYELSELFQIPIIQLLNPQLPIVRTVQFPSDLLDDLERAIKENCEISHEWKENSRRIENLRCALQPILDARDKALALPELDAVYMQPGLTVKKISLDARGEELIFQCIECQNRFIKNLYGENPRE